MPSVALKFRTQAWGTLQSPPTRFVLFHFGRNDTTKGPVYLSREGAERCVARWKARRIELAADFEHAALEPGTSGAPASAWFELAVGDDGLYAVNVRWSARAREYFQRGEYRYHSPFVNLEPDAQGKLWVVELINFALTNWPATDRQRPLVARAFAVGRRFTMLDPKQIEAMKEALKKNGMAEESLAGAILELMPIVCGGGAPAEAPAEEPMAAPEEEKKDEMPYVDVAATSAPTPLPASLKIALGLKADATDAAALALVNTYAKEREATAKRLAALESDKKRRDAEERNELFSAFKGKGKLRFAKETEAKALLEKHGAEAFKAAYGNVPDLEQPAPKQEATLPTTGIGAEIQAGAFASVQRKTGATVVNAEHAVPVAEIRSYMDKHNVGAAAAARALRAIGRK